MSDISTTELNKNAYLVLSNGNYHSLEEASDEFITILAEDEGDDVDVEALKGMMIATMNFLRTQRKLDKFLENNVPAPEKDIVDYALEVADTIGLSDNVTVTVNVNPDDNLLYRDLLNILYPTK
jgi:hypothetical protein